MTGPAGGPGAASRTPHGRRPWRGVALVLLVAAGLVALGVLAALVVEGRQRPSAEPAVPVSPGTAVPSSELVGEWSGDGRLTRCAGFEEADCTGSRPITLTVDCSGKRCAVTPFDATYGRPPLRFEDGAYRAAGPVPPELAPTCGGVPTRSALWRLELTVRDGRLVGSYAESTVQGFDCGATGLAWDVALERG